MVCAGTFNSWIHVSCYYAAASDVWAAALQKIMQGAGHAWYNHTVKLCMHGGAEYERHQTDI